MNRALGLNGVIHKYYILPGILQPLQSREYHQGTIGGRYGETLNANVDINRGLVGLVCRNQLLILMLVPKSWRVQQPWYRRRYSQCPKYRTLLSVARHKCNHAHRPSGCPMIYVGERGLLL